jgi:DNA-binding NarL/FixJ family response regulator
MTDPAVRLVVADDVPEMLDSLARLIDAFDDCEVVGRSGTGAGAIRLAAELDPDVAVLDLRMPDLDGITVANRITASRPEVAVVMLSGYADADMQEAAARAGVVRYVVKTASIEELHRAIRDAARESRARRSAATDEP